MQKFYYFSVRITKSKTLQSVVVLLLTIKGGDTKKIYGRSFAKSKNYTTGIYIPADYKKLLHPTTTV